jgi:hypothetical protein
LALALSPQSKVSHYHHLPKTSNYHHCPQSVVITLLKLSQLHTQSHYHHLISNVSLSPSTKCCISP